MIEAQVPQGSKDDLKTVNRGKLTKGNTHQVVFLGSSAMDILKARDGSLAGVQDYFLSVKVLNVILRMRMMSALDVQISARKLKEFRARFDALQSATELSARMRIIKQLRKSASKHAHLSYAPPNPRTFSRKRIGDWLDAEEQREAKGRPTAYWEVDTIASLLAAYPVYFGEEVEPYAQGTLTFIRQFFCEALQATARFKDTPPPLKSHLSNLLRDRSDSAFFKHIATATVPYENLGDPGKPKTRVDVARLELAQHFPDQAHILIRKKG